MHDDYRHPLALQRHKVIQRRIVRPQRAAPDLGDED
jgi:hypothetical protein